MPSNVIRKEDEKILLDTLNKKGFFLEDKVIKIVEKMKPSRIGKRKIIMQGNDNVEIDVILEIGEKHFIIECKRTDYSWIFAKEKSSPNIVTFIEYHGDAIGIVRSRPTIKIRNTSDFETTSFDIAVLFDSDGKIIRKKHKDINLAYTSYNDIHDHIRQVLKETDFYINVTDLNKKIFIPIIVTNAKLYQLSYSFEKLNSDGNLIEYDDLSEIDGVAYIISEWMRNVDGSISSGVSSPKTVFIVNVNRLEPFIHRLCSQDF